MLLAFELGCTERFGAEPILFEPPTNWVFVLPELDGRTALELLFMLLPDRTVRPLVCPLLLLCKTVFGFTADRVLVPVALEDLFGATLLG